MRIHEGTDLKELNREEQVLAVCYSLDTTSFEEAFALAQTFPDPEILFAKAAEVTLGSIRRKAIEDKESDHSIAVDYGLTLCAFAKEKSVILDSALEKFLLDSKYRPIVERGLASNSESLIELTKDPSTALIVEEVLQAHLSVHLREFENRGTQKFASTFSDLSKIVSLYAHLLPEQWDQYQLGPKNKFTGIALVIFNTSDSLSAGISDSKLDPQALAESFLQSMDILFQSFTDEILKNQVLNSLGGCLLKTLLPEKKSDFKVHLMNALIESKDLSIVSTVFKNPRMTLVTMLLEEHQARV